MFNIIINKILKIIKVKKINPISGEGSWVNHKEYAKNKNIKKLWMNMQNINLFKDMLDIRKLEYDYIVKNDYKLIYKCIVLNEVLTKNYIKKIKKVFLLKVKILLSSSKYHPEYSGSGLRAHNTYIRFEKKFNLSFDCIVNSTTYK